MRILLGLTFLMLGCTIQAQYRDTNIVNIEKAYIEKIRNLHPEIPKTIGYIDIKEIPSKDLYHFTDSIACTTFEGDVVSCLVDLLNTDYAHVKIHGISPQKFVRCRIRQGLGRFNDNSLYFQQAINMLSLYYNFKIIKSKDTIEVFSIKIRDSTQFIKYKDGDRPQNDSPSIKMTKDGRKLYTLFGLLLQNDLRSLTSFLTHNYRQIFVLDDSLQQDENLYNITLDTKEEKTIQDCEKELADNGLMITKKKMVQEIYHISFE